MSEKTKQFSIRIKPHRAFLVCISVSFLLLGCFAYLNSSFDMNRWGFSDKIIGIISIMLLPSLFLISVFSGKINLALENSNLINMFEHQGKRVFEIISAHISDMSRVILISVISLVLVKNIDLGNWPIAILIWLSLLLSVFLLLVYFVKMSHGLESAILENDEAFNGASKNLKINIFIFAMLF